MRHRGTIGGSIANNDPAADYPAACLGLGATIHTSKRQLKADQFFTGMFSTALEADEIVTAVEFPVPKASGYAKFPNPASLYAMVGVFRGAVGRRLGPGRGHGRRPWRLPGARHGGGAVEELLGLGAEWRSVEAKGLNSDLHASAEYRAHLISVMAKRAVEAAK